jgi:hemoglobin
MSDWDALGGDAVMVPLLTDFYARIDLSPIRRLFPPDLTETREKQIAFQRMFWGGEDRYTPWRGHPRLRARHLPFPIGLPEAEAWLACMEAAVAASAMPGTLRAPFLEQLRKTAYAMINQAPAAGT